MVKAWWWVLVLALAMPAAVHAAASGEAREFRLEGRIEIGPDGRVVEFKPAKEVSGFLGDVVEANIRTWVFEPVRVDGRAVPATSGMRLTLEARPTAEDGLSLRIKHVAFGAGNAGGVSMPPARYPADAARSMVGAKMMVAVRVDADGKVLDVAVEQTSLSGVAGARSASRFAKLFEDAVIAAAWTWRLGASESIDGVPVGSTERIPVEFTVTRAPVYSPGTVRPVPWLEQQVGPSAEELLALSQWGAQASGPELRLRTGVVGVHL